ncbi:Shedu anti-phage system protein SduA domain-containing protein [Pseudarthrobacter sp. lyk4-40-TYG-27]|uniref:Shedu immune nuclease family protein n=1 Tax=Pseudarthrobacter sp. lyk4-40-TYG-27 TaxID=3040305 RepID=UPI002553311C|nr:Shedu anti-phage system protein SduA domain-containing protein [Pseudarthrobacter sp. lyk4-40-TYG-27]
MSKDEWNFAANGFAQLPTPETEADFATLRTLGRTIVGRSFPLQFGRSNDVGQSARTIWQVIAENADRQTNYGDEGEEVEIHQSPGGRVQVKARVVRDQGRVVEIRFEKVTGRSNVNAQLTRLLNLDEEASKRLIDLCIALRSIDPGGDETIRIDEAALATALRDPRTLSTAYQLNPDQFKAVIEGDVSATDVVAIAARRKTLERFEELLSDPQAFEDARAGGTREAVWQRFFETNPWLLGVGLSGHLFTAWDEGRLERVVAGHSVIDVGKRVDALLTTTGIVRSLVFAEIKLHDDDLLEGNPYRPGTWAPSRAVVGGVAQSLVTVQRARDDIGSWLSMRDAEDFETGEKVFSGSPRSYLIIGTLESFTRDGQIHTEKVRSFELHRNNINMPEIITYDEVLARAGGSLICPHSRQIEDKNMEQTQGAAGPKGDPLTGQPNGVS